MKGSFLLRGVACRNQFRFFAADTTDIVQKSMDIHKLAPASAQLLGRMLTAALMMGADLKEDSAGLTLNIEAEGPLKGAIVVYEPVGKVKGYAKAPDFFSEVIKDNLQIGRLLGKGTLSIIKDMKLKAPVTGTIKLETGEIAEDIAHYYQQSEQIPTAVSLGVLFNHDGTVRSAGGYIIQQMPDTTPEDAEALMSNLSKTPFITDLLDMGMSWEDILGKLIFREMDWSVTQEIQAEYYCSCSRERFAKALLLLGKEDLETLSEGISPVCHYCGKTYEFSAADMQEILDSLDNRSV